MRVASDIGGTFTDLIYLDEATGEIGMTKASTTPHNFAVGVEDTLEKSGIKVADTTFFVHGSTIISTVEGYHSDVSRTIVFLLQVCASATS